jgi:hypothetical protein
MYNSSRAWWNWRPPAGFRFAWTDGIAIIACALTTRIAWPYLGDLSLLFPFVLAHFFLFCNVFRIRRSLELFWSAAFLIVCVIWLRTGHFTLAHVFWTQLPISLLVIAIGFCQRDYHGVGYKHVSLGRRPWRKEADDPQPDARAARN